jgi:thioesterase domain-containing protein
VKIRGFRIELGEIERRLAEYDGVDEAVVVAREDAADDPRLVAYYTHAAAKGKAEDTPEAELLRAHLAGTLPEYMVPAAYVRLNSLPLSVNGKLDRRALPAPDAGAYAAKRYEAPVGDIEAQLSVIWAEELRLERVGRHDNFFDLGGHSLLAVSLLTRVEREFHMRLPLVTMHRAPSIAQMAHLLSREGSRASIGDRMIRLSEGCEPALFCLPGSGCDVLTLRDFASIIRERAVYGIQMKGISGEAPPLSTIGEMAADCIGLIKTVQPEGPYYLAGYSAGALIGFEAARRLRLQGERIGSLILLDPAVPERRAGWVGYLDAAENIFKRTRYHLARLSRLRMRSWFFYVHDKRVRAAAISGATGEVLGARATLYETTNQATLAYKPSPYAGTGLIVHAKTRPESFENLSIWPKLLRGGANSIAVDGDHFSILKPPSLHSIAEEINTHISGNSRRFTISRGGGPKAGVDGSGGGEGQGA